MNDSILDETKKLLGIEADYSHFDLDIITHINSVFSTLHGLGVGPTTGYMITSNTEKWEDFLGTDIALNQVKSYIFLRVRLMFDPPATSFAQESMSRQAQEMEWRLNVHAEGVRNPWVDPRKQYQLTED